MFKKITLITFSLTLLSFILITSPVLVFAFACPPSQGTSQPIIGGITDFTNPCSLLKLALNILAFLNTIGGVIVAIFIVIAGLRYMTAGGSPERIEGAKKALTAAVVGAVIIILAFVIIKVLNNVLYPSLLNLLF